MILDVVKWAVGAYCGLEFLVVALFAWRWYIVTRHEEEVKYRAVR